MKTIVLNLNDTIASCDTLVVKMVNAKESCLSMTKETETNFNDVLIVALICAVIVFLAWYGISNYFKNKKVERECKNNMDEEKRKQDVEDQKNKQLSEVRKELMNFHRELAFPYEKLKVDDELKFVKKPYEKEGSEKYIKHLDELIEKLSNQPNQEKDDNKQ